jgi:hypothetical protein
VPWARRESTSLTFRSFARRRRGLVGGGNVGLQGPAPAWCTGGEQSHAGSVVQLRPVSSDSAYADYTCHSRTPRRLLDSFTHPVLDRVRVYWRMLGIPRRTSHPPRHFVVSLPRNLGSIPPHSSPHLSSSPHDILSHPVSSPSRGTPPLQVDCPPRLILAGTNAF